MVILLLTQELSRLGAEALEARISPQQRQLQPQHEQVETLGFFILVHQIAR
jgi:hypothetical protein